jgi:hypothetical protein
MIKKDCRCGKSTKNFFRDVGPFYIDKCCTDAGYDHLGKLKETKPKDLGLSEQDAAQIESATLAEDKSPEPQDPPEVETPKAPEKPKRTYNRGGNVKKNDGQS